MIFPQVEELMPVDSLLEYLLDYPERIVMEHDLYVWAAQTSCGMRYLETQKFVHRDLATRNILLKDKTQVMVSAWNHEIAPFILYMWKKNIFP